MAIQWQTGPVGERRRRDYEAYQESQRIKRRNKPKNVAKRQLAKQAKEGGPGRRAVRGAGGAKGGGVLKAKKMAGGRKTSIKPSRTGGLFSQLRTKGRPARKSRSPAGGARTHRDGPGGEPGIPPVSRPRRIPPRRTPPRVGGPPIKGRSGGYEKGGAVKTKKMQRGRRTELTHMGSGRPIQWQTGPVGQRRRRDYMDYVAPGAARRQLAKQPPGRRAANIGPGGWKGGGAVSMKGGGTVSYNDLIRSKGW